MKITLKIHPHNQDEVRKMIEALIVLNGGQAPTPLATQPAVTQPAITQPAKTEEKKAAKPLASVPATQPTSPAPVPVAEAAAPVIELKAEDGTVITDEVLRAKVQEKIVAGFRDKIKAEVVRIGAANVSTIKPENYVEFYKFLTELKNE